MPQESAKIRLIHGGVKETHVFHLHNHQWRLEAENPSSTILDSITLGPQECYTLDILHGAGSLTGTIGDVIFHCHLYPHFHEGMWTLWRIHDRLEDGSGTLPDGTKIPPLIPLKDRELPLPKDKPHPGYPAFISGVFTERPLQPPFGILNPDGSSKIEPTDLERDNFVNHFVPGALYSNTCPCHAGGSPGSCPPCCSEDKDVKVFEIAAVQAKITYNRYGWHDPQGRFFVLKEDLETHGGLDSYIRKVEEQKIRVEPLVIRANAGDCIEFRFTNLLPDHLEESPFQMETLTDIVGHHVHLVKFDTVVSDGAANGWNNIAGARQYETLIERFFADSELRTVFFHDHLFANSHQMHGMFGAMIIEEAGATFHSIHSGSELRRGTQAVIRRRDGTSFREFALFVHDFAFLFDKKGIPLNPPEVPGSHDDPGVMGINYRCEPMPERLKNGEDPAYIFSSFVHGDPATPILETYPGDEIIIRLLDGAHEEQHSFNLTGLSWHKEIADPHSPLAASQTIGISEAFNLRITGKYDPKPLILRANAGDWIEVTLHNLFDPKQPVEFFDYPRVPLDFRHKPSMRVSLNPQYLHYDPVCDSGINIGYNNREQTVGVGESRKYLWYADREYGPCIIQSFGDMRNHRYHGLFGAIIIEPAGAQWYRNFSLSRALHEEEAVITAPGVESFRECVVMIQNGIRMLDADGELVKTIPEEEGNVDTEDTGEKGYNYRSERFANRLKQDRRISRIFSSRIHGASCPGDYLYRSGSFKWDVESGMWGIFRVLKQGIGCKCKNVCRKMWQRIFRE